MNPLVVGVGLATLIGLVLLGRRADAASGQRSGGVKADDIGDLARVLVVELDGGGTDAERAGIVHVAINRSRLYGAPIADVIRSRVAGRSEWGSGCGGSPTCAYNRELDAARTHPAFGEMADVTRAILEGDIPNSIGGRLTFCHPRHPTFARSRARGTVEDQRRAFDLRDTASMMQGAEARRRYEEANRIEQVDSRYAWDPLTGRYLPTWTIEPRHGGKSATIPITIGSTRFA